MILKHRDRELLRFEWLNREGVRILSVNEAERRYLPLEMKGEATDEAVLKWMRRRSVPKNRAYIAQMLDNLGLPHDDLRGMIAFSRGLSLNDVYWVVSEQEASLKWADVSLYSNEFSKVIAFMAFTGTGGNVSPGSTSPEMTTNGMLAKCWRRINGVPTLYKGGTEGAANSGFEPYSEFYAAQIAKAMELDHVPYGLARFKGRLCSTCPIFTSERQGYLPVGHVRGVEEALADPRFANIFLFDAVICNPDRHLGNFGYLIDNDTNEISGAAPIFDNGYGLFSLALFRNKYIDEFADLGAYAAKRAPALYRPWLNIPGGITEDMRQRVMKLNGFRFTSHANYNLPTERLRILEDFLQKRIREIACFGSEIRLDCKTSALDDTGKSKSRSADDTDEQILEHLQTDPFVSLEELAEMLHVSVITVKRRVANLKKTNRIRRVGSTKTGHWEILK